MLTHFRRALPNKWGGNEQQGPVLKLTVGQRVIFEGREGKIVADAKGGYEVEVESKNTQLAWYEREFMGIKRKNPVVLASQIELSGNDPPTFDISNDFSSFFDNIFEQNGDIQGTKLNLTELSKQGEQDNDLVDVCLDLMMYKDPKVFEGNVAPYGATPKGRNVACGACGAQDGPH